MDQIRHIYLHYVVEPMVYSRGTAMERIQPLLRSVQDAPLEFFYKSDVVALMTESLIKAIEARMYVIAAAPPPKPKSKDRADLEATVNECSQIYVALIQSFLALGAKPDCQKFELEPRTDH